MRGGEHVNSFPRTRRLIAAAAAALLASCAAPPTPVEYARTYPAQTPRGRTLDIQVFKGATTLRLTNATAHAFGPSTIWLNSYFSRPIDGLAVGQTLSLPLSSFRNEHSEAFRGGGFFAPDFPEKLVLAELETTAPEGTPVLLGLIVIGSD